MSKSVVDVDALYSALNAKRQAEGTSWRRLAQQLGIASSTFTRLAQGKRPDVDTFATLVRWLGVPADTFMQSRSSARREPDVESAAVISAFLRADRQLTPEAVAALEELIAVAYRTLLHDNHEKEQS